jgi:probable F420-dependent oxidoreductase
MHLAIRLPYHTDVVSGEVMTSVAVAADKAGMHSGWVADHIVFPAGEVASVTPTTASGKYPRPLDEPTLESWTSLAYVAGATKRLGLGVGICVVPYRNPLLLAKVIASLDVLSGGRVLCGVGLGWLQEEFEALQVPYEKRRDRMLEGIALMRRCWESSPVQFEGEHFRIEQPVHFVPRPVGRVPIIMGGHSDPALRRAATIADGWIGHELSPADCATMRAKMVAAAGGALPDGFQLVNSRLMNVPGSGPGEAGKLDITSPEQLADVFASYEEAGVDILLCESTVRTGETLLRLVHEAHAAGDRRGMMVA